MNITDGTAKFDVKDKRKPAEDILLLKEEISQLKLAIEGIKNEISDDENFTILYPKGTKESPYKISTNERFEIDNPFPGYHVFCRTQVSRNNSWGTAGWYTANSYGRFISSEQILPKDKIAIQTGRSYVSGESNLDGNPFNTTTVMNQLSFRVLVFKLGKIEE